MVSVTFTSWLISNHTTKMSKVPIEINGNIHLSQIWQGETSKEFTIYTEGTLSSWRDSGVSLLLIGWEDIMWFLSFDIKEVLNQLVIIITNVWSLELSIWLTFGFFLFWIRLFLLLQEKNSKIKTPVGFELKT